MAIVQKRPNAIADLEEISGYIACDNPNAAQRFLEAAERIMELLAEFPGLGPRFRSKKGATRGMRFFPIPGFKSYLVFYQPVKQGIEVVRVLYGGRDLPRLIPENGR